MITGHIFLTISILDKFKQHLIQLHVVVKTLTLLVTFDTMTAMAKFSEWAATYPNIIIPGSRMLPLDSPT